ncbi:MAG: serine/threonine-protein kinase [Terriglobales bacterium]
MTEEANKRIGDYQILDELGSGGMGRVWRVRNVITDRIEAMKVLLPDLAGRQELAARFQREIKLMASLNHPNIAALRTAFTADNQLYMVMEYVEGTNLADKLEKGPIPVGDAVNYISQVLSAVSYAHQQHIIHRDIKPANMMLTPQGVIKLMDFGIARAGEERSLTMTGTTMGSLSYMSPEQVKGEATDARSDLYSVGVSLYEFVTGQRPFTATSDYSIMAAHVKEAPKPPVELHPGLPAALNEIILMAIAKDPEQRFQTADAFRNALSSVPVSAPTPAMLEATTVESMAALPKAPAAPAATPAAPVAALKSSTPPPPSPTPMPMPPPAQGSGHRGLYMTLGALIVLAGLVVAGIYVPRISKTHAKGPEANSVEQTADTATPGEAQPSQPTPSDAPAAGAMSSDSSQPPAAPAATTASVDNSSAMQSAPPATPAAPQMEKPVQSNLAPAKPSHSHAKKVMAQSGAMSGDAGAPPQGDSGMAAPEAANSSAQLDELEQTVDQLSNRAAAVNSGLDRLQQEQSASGYGLRGDMVERQASLKANLFKAEEAMQHHDAVRAKKYADMAGKDLEVLERFLGH